MPTKQGDLKSPRVLWQDDNLTGVVQKPEDVARMHSNFKDRVYYTYREGRE